MNFFFQVEISGVPDGLQWKEVNVSARRKVLGIKMMTYFVALVNCGRSPAVVGESTIFYRLQRYLMIFYELIFAIIVGVWTVAYL
jgi:hypothetical protein